MAFKIVIENPVLRGSRQNEILQLVATLYEDGVEYRVMAPPRAIGDAIQWYQHFSVRKPTGLGDEDITGQRRDVMIAEVVKALEQQMLAAQGGKQADAPYHPAQICLRGHVQSSDGKTVIRQGEHCSQCGDVCVDSCRHCKAPIRGQDVNLASDYVRPSFCFNCGRPYPWMEDRLQAAKELLDHDDKLSLEERTKLWGLLQYVMSDPKSDMVPAKKKLIEINIQKAATATRDFVTDLMAKYLAEMSKPG